MLKNFAIFTMMSMSAAAFAELPEAKVDYGNVYQSHATLAGRLTSKPTEPLGVTIENGGLKYSTITDADGNWGLVFKYRSGNYTINTFELQNPASKGSEVKGKLENAQ